MIVSHLSPGRVGNPAGVRALVRSVALVIGYAVLFVAGVAFVTWPLSLVLPRGLVTPVEWFAVVSGLVVFWLRRRGRQ